MDHQDVIAKIRAALIDCPPIQSLFLSGSYGNGLADAYSDIDFVLVAEQGATDEIAALWKSAIEQTGEIVLWWDRSTVPVLINAITDDWTRTDVLILKPDQLGAQAQSLLKPVFDHRDYYATLLAAPKEAGPQAGKFKYQVENFIRILGLLHLAAGREEYINGVLGVFHLRNSLVELLIEETNAPNRGGVLHLNRLITPEQRKVLTDLPPAVPERDAMISAHLAYAKVFLPRARLRAKETGMEWPERFEAATWARLQQSLGIECPYEV